MLSQRTVIFVAGPAGSGKTTLVKRLRERAATYVETSALNPYFAGRTHATFDAEASQTWFLDQIALFLSCHPTEPVIIDQHPRVVSRVYGAMFHDQQLLSDVTLKRLDGYADRIWKQVVKSSTNVLTVCLSASTGSLRARLQRRKSRGLTMSEVSSVNRLYAGVVFLGPCLAMNTDVVSVQREKVIVDAWLSNPRATRLDRGLR